MTRKSIPFENLLVKSHHLWDETWLVLTCGDFAQGSFNAMTVGWGSLGTMWNRPFAQVVVRPTRHTYQFMERFNSFTLCAFPEKYREAVRLLGTKSGRDGDKIREAGLTPIASSRVAAPGFKEAELIIECNKIYWDDLDPSHFVEPTLERHYPGKDYHRFYFGEIIAILGKDYYCG